MLPKNLLTYLLEKYPNRAWSYDNLLKNPNITIKNLKKYITINDDIIYYISTNQNITLKFIEEYIDLIDFENLSENQFIFHNNQIKIIYEKSKLFYYLTFTKIIYDIKRYTITF